jgi:2-keto-3-deoxy-L-rhamnonate aldolase RhmA
VRDNQIKRNLAGGPPAFGISLTITDPFVTEVVGGGGFDFVLIDTEHGPIALDQLQSMLMALRHSSSIILVRPAANDPTLIKQILDLGAEGIVVPEISSAADAAAAVAAAKYPPLGRRGFGPRRAARLEGGRAIYIDRANDEIAVVVMIENQNAVAKFDDILATPGLDGILVGPADLAVSMGHLRDLGNAEVQEAIEKIFGICEQHGFPFGIYAAAEPAARKWAERGARLVTIGSDIQFVDAGIIRAQTLARELSRA